MFITGLSGNGKTFSVEQACAKAKRECVRVNLTIETDEDDLIIINKSGVMIRMVVKDLRVMGRATQGVKIIRLKDDDSIASVAKVSRFETEEKEPLEGEEGEGKNEECSEEINETSNEDIDESSEENNNQNENDDEEN